MKLGLDWVTIFHVYYFNYSEDYHLGRLDCLGSGLIVALNAFYSVTPQSPITFLLPPITLPLISGLKSSDLVVKLLRR